MSWKTVSADCLGKKNWLFAGSERAGQRAAAIQTLLHRPKLNGLNPEEWLKDTLEKLADLANSRIDELLPLTPAMIEKTQVRSVREDGRMDAYAQVPRRILNESSHWKAINLRLADLP